MGDLKQKTFPYLYGAKQIISQVNSATDQFLDKQQDFADYRRSLGIYTDEEKEAARLAAIEQTQEELSDPSLNGEDYDGYFQGYDHEWYPGYIQLNTDNNDDYQKGVALHELNHSIQNSLIPNYNDSYDIPYHERKHEIHSNIMAIRRGLGLDPNKRDYTEKDAYQMYLSLVNASETGNQSVKVVGSWINAMLRKYGTEFYSKLANWLNTLADADTKSDPKLKNADQHQDLQTWQSQIASAKNGGSIDYLKYFNYNLAK